MRFIACLLLVSLTAMAKSPVENIEWSQTPVVLHGREVTVSLKSGSRVKGEWSRVTPDSFTITGSNGASNSYSRSDIKLIKASKTRVARRWIGVGAMTALIGGLASAATGSSEGLQSPWAFVLVGGVVGGYYLGRSLDRDTREVVILPDKVAVPGQVTESSFGEVR